MRAFASCVFEPFLSANGSRCDDTTPFQSCARLLPQAHADTRKRFAFGRACLPLSARPSKLAFLITVLHKTNAGPRALGTSSQASSSRHLSRPFRSLRRHHPAHGKRSCSLCARAGVVACFASQGRLRTLRASKVASKCSSSC
eukprot:6205629-Pleurochrysis_carterae.AAC.1